MQTLRNAASDQRQQTTDRRGCRVSQGRNAQNKNKRGGRNAKDAGGTSYHISCHKEVVEIRRIQLNVQCPESPSADQSTGTHKGTQLISYQCWPAYRHTQGYTTHQLPVLTSLPAHTRVHNSSVTSADQSTGTHKGTQLISYQCWPVYTQLISYQCWPVYTQLISYQCWPVYT